MDTAIAAQAWERQPGEPALWFDRFYNYYRPLGTGRSLNQAYLLWAEAETQRRVTAARNQGIASPEIRLAKRPTKAWYAAAKDYNWELRAHAWDVQQQRLKLEVEEQARQEMLENHAQLATAMLTGVARRLNELLGDKDNPRTPRLTPREMKEWAALAIKIERESRGLPGEITQQEVSGEINQNIALQGIVAGVNLGNLQSMDDEELDERIAALERELGKQPPAPGNSGNGSKASTAVIEGRTSGTAANPTAGDNTDGQGG